MLKVRGFCYTAMAYSFVFFKYTATFLDAKFTVKTKVIVQYWHRVYIILAYSMALPLHSPVFTDDLRLMPKATGTFHCWSTLRAGRQFERRRRLPTTVLSTSGISINLKWTACSTLQQAHVTRSCSFAHCYISLADWPHLVTSWTWRFQTVF